MKLIRIGVLSALVASACGCAQYTQDERQVLRTTERFFRAAGNQNQALAGQSLVPEGMFVNVRQDRGRQEVESINAAEWLARRAARDAAIRERLVGQPLVRVDGDVAVLWSEYEREVNGEVVHKGTEVFGYVRTPEGWKIAGGAASVLPAD